MFVYNIDTKKFVTSSEKSVTTYKLNTVTVLCALRKKLWLIFEHDDRNQLGYKYYYHAVKGRYSF